MRYKIYSLREERMIKTRKDYKPYIPLVSALLKLNISAKQIARLAHILETDVKRIRYHWAYAIDRTHPIPAEPPGCGDFGDCSQCRAHVRLPCAKCVTLALASREKE